MVRYRVEDAVVDTSIFELTVGGRAVPVEPQVFEVLSYLIKHHDRLVSRTELLDTIWGDRFVSDSALTSRVAAARAAIGDDGRSQRCIRTVHGRGLQFVAPVRDELTHTPEDDVEEPGLAQSTRFVAAPDGTQLAVATMGSGRTLVKAANWLTHVELDWRSPVWRHWNDAFASRFRYIRYDSRVCGLSDRDLGGTDLSDLDVWVGDLSAVVDDSGADSFALLGVSQGAGPAMAYAVRHPEKVSLLLLYGAYTADAESALRLEAALHDADFSELARRVSVHDRAPLQGRSRDAVRGGTAPGEPPGAEFVTLDSANHILTETEPAWRVFLEHLDRFTSQHESTPAVG